MKKTYIENLRIRAGNAKAFYNIGLLSKRDLEKQAKDYLDSKKISLDVFLFDNNKLNLQEWKNCYGK